MEDLCRPRGSAIIAGFPFSGSAGTTVNEQDKVFMQRFGAVLVLLLIFAFVAYYLGSSIAGDAQAGAQATESATVKRIKPVGTVKAEKPAAAPAQTAAPAKPAEKAPAMAKAAEKVAAPAASVASTAETVAAKAADAVEKAAEAPKEVAAAVVAKAEETVEKVTAKAEETVDKVKDAAASAVAAVAPAAAPAAPAAPAADLAAGKMTYEKVCKACHDLGIANAPKTGDKEAWSQRAGAGLGALVASVVNGKGAMPPKAANPALTEQDITASVQWFLHDAGVDAAQ